MQIRLNSFQKAPSKSIKQIFNFPSLQGCAAGKTGINFQPVINIKSFCRTTANDPL
jgi:hypothetical protein